MLADDRQPFHQRHPLAIPNFRLDRAGGGCAAVRADEANGGARTGHYEAGSAISLECREADLVEIHNDRPGNAVRPGREADRAGLEIDERLDGLSVVGLTVASGPVIEHRDVAGPRFFASEFARAAARALALTLAAGPGGDEYREKNYAHPENDSFSHDYSL